MLAMTGFDWEMCNVGCIIMEAGSFRERVIDDSLAVIDPDQFQSCAAATSPVLVEDNRKHKKM